MQNSGSSGVTLSTLRELQEKYGVSASKALGQNFLVDPNMPKKIAALIKPEESVLEVGPGVGSLTVALAKSAKKVVAIEYDKHILDPLQDVLNQFNVSDRVHVINEDVMTVDLEKICSENNINTIAGNLPYNISAPLLANIARFVPSAKFVVAMVQKEVGDRFCAKQKTREVSAVTLKTQLFMEVNSEFKVARQSFVPQPRVDSVIITMKRRSNLALDIESSDIEPLFSLIDTGFSQRRKMMRQSLKSLLGEKISDIFTYAGLDSTLRPEQCDLNDFAKLLKSWKVLNGN